MKPSPRLRRVLAILTARALLLEHARLLEFLEACARRERMEPQPASGTP